MTTYLFRREQWVPRPLPIVFDFFSRAENLERITPPRMRFHIISPLPIRMDSGATIEYALRVHGFPVRWLTEIETWNPPYEFIDVQAKGPYKLWRHTHRFREFRDGTLVEDSITYALPFGPLGRVLNQLLVAKDISGIFDYRAQTISALFD